MRTLPPPAPTVDPLSVRAIVDEETSRMYRRALGVRAVGAPLIGVLAAVVAWADPAPWRVALMGSIFVGIVGASLISEWRARTSGVGAAWVPANFMLTAGIQLLMVAGTGGVDSPMLLVIVPLAFASSVALGRRPVLAALLGMQIATVLALTVVQVAEIGPALALPMLAPAEPPPALHRALVGIVACIVVGVGGGFGVYARGRFEAMVAAAVSARGEQLATWVQWSRDLETLGGEIAHELKNPLASVKGLAALVARDLPEGRAATRIGVLQGEVDRMAALLDEQLAFSRPLTPLTRAPVDAVALCRSVAELHEGVGRSAGVTLSVHGEPVMVDGDRRKLLQVLVNLVQNALHAAPPGSTVDLTARPTADRVVIEVADRGPGLSEDLRGRVFSPGVTSREHGSGLGLTIALAIARQHGGEIALQDRDGGGTLAQVTLPARSEAG